MKAKKYNKIKKLPMAEYGLNIPQYGYNPYMINRQWQMQQQDQMQPLQSAGMQPMSVNGPDMNIQDAGSEQPTMTQSNTPGKMGAGIAGAAMQAGQAAGQLFNGAISALPALGSFIPDQNKRNLRPYQGPTYNPLQYGNRESTLYKDGGIVKARYGYKTVQRKQGNTIVTEEVPIGFEDQQPQQSMAPAYSTPFPVPPQKKSLSYEKLNQGNYEFYSPVFNGDWSSSERQQSFNNGLIPQQYQGYDVARGDQYNELWNNDGTPANNSYVPQYNPYVNLTNNMGKNAQNKKPFSPYNFKDGGKLSAGQTINISPEQKLQYEKMGYKFS